MKDHVQVIDLGTVPYGAAFDMQKEAVRHMLAGELEPTLYLLEHPPVFTIGRAGGEFNVLVDQQQREELGIELFEVDRGGDVTYHGPGQLVGYPILRLEPWGNDVRKYIRMIEEVGIRLLQNEYGIEASRFEGQSGVWVGREKICAIGVKASRDRMGKTYITSHGFAFNVHPNLSHFSYIVPCGITDKGVTSLYKLTGKLVPMDTFKEQWIRSFADVFEVGVV